MSPRNVYVCRGFVGDCRNFRLPRGFVGSLVGLHLLMAWSLLLIQLGRILHMQAIAWTFAKVTNECQLHVCHLYSLHICCDHWSVIWIFPYMLHSIQQCVCMQRLCGCLVGFHLLLLISWSLLLSTIASHGAYIFHRRLRELSLKWLMNAYI